jgi:hypothetical protein
MSCGKTYKDQVKNEKFLSLYMKGAQTVEIFFMFYYSVGTICKIKARFGTTIILRATDRPHSRMLHKTAHVTLNKQMLFCDVVGVLWNIT